jgi:hypothetical protein
MKTDMSPQAVTERLKLTSQLRSLCISLGGVRIQARLKKQLEKHHPPAEKPPTP